MRHIREILRQKLAHGLSNREVARSLRVSTGSVSGMTARARELGLTLDEITALTDVALEERFYGVKGCSVRTRPLPDPATLHVELRRTGVTLQLLHHEYLEQHPSGYRYTQFCAHYNEWLARIRPTMRQVHRAGEKLFVDYSGKKPSIIDGATGEVIEVELFVATLGASNFVYAEATLTQRVHDWIGSHVRTFEALGGVPQKVVPDQLKSGVTRACWYEPEVQRTYAEMAQHYGTVVVPARPRSPRDKAKVENAVLIAQRWVLAKSRNQRFFSLAALNERIDELVFDLNARTMKTYGASRRELFERLDKPALRPLASERYELATWKQVRVNIDYHVEFERHFYSVPHALVRDDVEVRATSSAIEVFARGVRVASHMRSAARGRHTTDAAHMPKSHQRHLEWSPTRIVAWASTIGPETTALVESILTSRPHPEQGYRSCLGILRLSKRYGATRLEAGCARAVRVGARSYKHVESILKNGLDRIAPDPPRPLADAETLLHENVRGRDYYH